MMYPFFMPQQQQGNSMSMKDMKKLYKAFIMAQKEMEATSKKPEEKKKEEEQKKNNAFSKGEVLAYMWVLSPVIGLMTCNLYLYCFTQMKHTLSAFGAQ